MLETLIQTQTSQISLLPAIEYTIVSLIYGLILSMVYRYTNKKFSKNFSYSLLVLPAIVSIVIMLVNGSLGTGIAVAGAFSLIRFRSAQGSSKDIATIFLAMAVGLSTGTGYLLFGGIITLLFSIIYIIFTLKNKSNENKILKITVPENLEYNQMFDSLLKKYTDYYNLLRVKTTNMGSLYEIEYEINLKDNVWEKELIDEIRIMNGNLPILLSSTLLKEGVEF